eukprot:752982-Hanusia_phi.AAC.2
MEGRGRGGGIECLTERRADHGGASLSSRAKDCSLVDLSESLAPLLAPPNSLQDALPPLDLLPRQLPPPRPHRSRRRVSSSPCRSRSRASSSIHHGHYVAYARARPRPRAPGDEEREMEGQQERGSEGPRSWRNERRRELEGGEWNGMVDTRN